MTAICHIFDQCCGKIFSISIIISSDAARHISGCTDHTCIDAAGDLCCTVLRCCVLSSNSTHILGTADCTLVGTAGNDSVIFSGNTGCIISTSYCCISNTVLDGSLILRRNGCCVVSADHFSGYFQVLDRTFIPCKETCFTIGLAVQVLHCIACTVKDSGKCAVRRGSADRYPCLMIQIHISCQCAFDICRRLCCICKPLQFSRCGDLVDAILLCRRCGCMTIPAIRIYGRLVRIRFVASRLPLEDRITLITILAIFCKLVSQSGCQCF